MPLSILRTSLLKSKFPFHSLILLLHFPISHPLQLQKALATTQFLNVHQLVPRIAQITQIPLELLFLPCDRGSSPLLQLLLVNLSHRPLHHLSRNSIKMKHMYNFLFLSLFLLHSSFPLYSSLHFSCMQTMRLSFLFQA